MSKKPAQNQRRQPPRRGNSAVSGPTAALVAAIMAHGISTSAQSQTSTNQAGVSQSLSAAPQTNTPGTNAPVRLPETVVTGQSHSYQSIDVSLPKFTEPLRDTPQSITVVPRELMDDQNTTTLRDALRNVAGISIAAGEGSSQGDNLTLRGFAARSDIYNDGMRDFGSYYRDPFNMQEVEVLKGPSGMLFGRGSTGGVINQESKSPLLAPFGSVSASFGTDLTRRGTVDLNEPLPELGTNTAVRLNLMGNDSGVADRDVTENRRFGVAPSLAFGVGTPTRLTLSYFHQSEDDIPDYGVPWLLNAPAPVARDNFYGFRDDYLKTEVDIGTVKLEHDFSDNVTLRDQLRYANYWRNFRITEPQATNNPPNAPLSSDYVMRNELGGQSLETFLWDQLDLKAEFHTGFVDHVLVAGIEGGRETSDPIRYNYAGVPTTSLLAPDEEQNFSGASSYKSQIRTTAYSTGLYAFDTLKLGEHFELSGGGRWDYFDASYRQSVAPAMAFDQILEKPTWRGALVYKPVENGSIYFDWGTSFDPSAEALSLTTATAGAPPEENETFELGSKWDFLANQLSLRGALFRTEKTNAREPDPTDPTLDVDAGQEQVDGLELEAAGHLTEHWQVFANYALMESKLVSSEYYKSFVGLPLGNVPKNTASLWTTWALVKHWEVGGGIDYVGSRTASVTAPYASNGLIKEVPDYWTLSAMIKYEASKHLDLQLNLYNLTDNEYYDQIHPQHVIPGAGLSALLNVKYKF